MIIHGHDPFFEELGDIVSFSCECLRLKVLEEVLEIVVSPKVFNSLIVPLVKDKT